MEIAIPIFIFLVCFVISSILNILFKMTEKRNWLITVLISIAFAIIFTPFIL